MNPSGSCVKKQQTQRVPPRGPRSAEAGTERLLTRHVSLLDGVRVAARLEPGTVRQPPLL